MSETYGSDYLAMEQMLAHNDIDVVASEADGRLAGLLAMIGTSALDVWLAQLLAAGEQNIDALRVERAEPLRLLAAKRADVIEGADALPVLCLPDDDDDLRDRVDALVHWSAGFLSGLAEGAALAGPQAATRLEQEPLAEMLKDLSEITQAAISDEELASDIEQAESAYVELVEFLRVACQLAYENLADMRAAAPSTNTSDHIH
ncbi:MAG: UPF0149 family protein [Pseudomonadota bacterium]